MLQATVPTQAILPGELSPESMREQLLEHGFLRVNHPDFQQADFISFSEMLGKILFLKASQKINTVR